MSPAVYVLRVTWALLVTVGAATNTMADPKAQVIVRASADSITKELIQYIATVGATTVVRVEKAQPLGDLVRRHCGSADPYYLDLLSEGFANQRPADKFHEVILSPGQEVVLPACLRVVPSRVKTHIVQRDDKPWRYFVADPAGFAAFAEPQQLSYMAKFGELNSEYAQTGLLREGAHVRIPVSGASWSVIELREGISAATVTARLTNIAALSGGKVLDADNPEQIQLYSEVGESRLKSLNACQPETGSDAVADSTVAFDSLEVLATLAHNGVPSFSRTLL